MNRYKNNTKWRILLPLLLLLLLLLFTGPAIAGDAESAAADYETLMQWKFSTSAMTLPADGVRFQRDGAEWILSRGTIRPMRPTTDGSVTGLVFEGTGVFRMTIPDPVEINQLHRFTGADAVDTLEFNFGRMVIRTTDDRVTKLFPAGSSSEFEENALAKKRHLWWLEYARFDADARITAGLLNGDTEYLAIDMETEEHGWLLYEFEPWRMEEIRLCRMRKSFEFVEVWVSLDRAGHRRPDGRPGDTRTPLLDLVHADLEADIMNKRFRKTSGRELPDTSFRARMEFESTMDGLQALPLRLFPYSRNVTATSAGGEALPVLRAPLGRRFPMIDHREEDTSLVVILDRPLAQGERVEISFTWERQSGSGPGGWLWSATAGGGLDWYPPFTRQRGRYWYPEPLEGWDDQHTARVTITHPKRIKVRATGTPVAGRKEGRKRISSWECNTPIKAAVFSSGRRYTERRILVEGLPEVIAFGKNRWTKIGDTVEAAAAHMADCIQFYQLSFDHVLPQDAVIGSRSGHNRSYSGFIAYGARTFDLVNSWDSEWLLARRTADLFWGEPLDWESYRDQWLADALSGYSALMYLEAVTEGWNRQKKGVIGTYDEYLRLKQRQLAYATSYRNERLGPLALGFRDIVPELMTAMNQSGILTISSRDLYPLPPPSKRRNLLPNSIKGPAVLHMLRGILRSRSEDGARQFNAILADFLNTHAGKTASTREFIATVERLTGEDWDWFFDQWVYGTDVPAYSWSHTVTAEPDADGLYPLTIQLAQTGVSPDFRMPVTFGVEYEEGESELLHFDMDQPSKTFTARVPHKPAKVTFDPDHDLLYVKERGTNE